MTPRPSAMDHDTERVDDVDLEPDSMTPRRSAVAHEPRRGFGKATQPGFNEATAFGCGSWQRRAVQPTRYSSFNAPQHLLDHWTASRSPIASKTGFNETTRLASFVHALASILPGIMPPPH